MCTHPLGPVRLDLVAVDVVAPGATKALRFLIVLVVCGGAVASVRGRVRRCTKPLVTHVGRALEG
jgi:hypothetical protein